MIDNVTYAWDGEVRRAYKILVKNKTEHHRLLNVYKYIFKAHHLPGILAGEMGPDLDWLLPAGEPTGEGDGPPGMLERCGEAWGEKGDCAGLLCSPWLLVEPDALTAELNVASVPVGRSSMEPDKSWEERRGEIDKRVVATSIHKKVHVILERSWTNSNLGLITSNKNGNEFPLSYINMYKVYNLYMYQNFPRH